MSEKTVEKPAGKLILFNHSRNPYHLGKNADGSQRIFAVGESIECIDQAEYDMLKNYKGVGTTQQVAPSLQAHVSKLESEKAALTDEVEALRKQLEKFKAQFNREFSYGPSLAQVQDNDIQRAINETSIAFNPGLWDGTTPLGSTTELNIVYLYVSAHFLALNVQGAGGLSSVNRGRGVKSAGGGTIQSKSVGSVSVTYVIPEDIQNSPILGQFMRTDFGQKYLTLLTPRLVGNVGLVSGQSFSPAVFNTVIQPLQITTLTLAGGTHSIAYSQTLKATGGIGQYTWSKVSGTFPTGLTLAALTGIISGTPSVIGTYYFEMLVTDVMGNTAAMNYQVVIA